MQELYDITSHQKLPNTETSVKWVGEKTCISEKFCPFYMKFYTVLTISNKS